jgi:hypothetical protein
LAQITIYLDPETTAKLKAIAKNSNLSQSKWIANLIKEKVRNDWPESIIKLAGAWKDFPTAEELRRESVSDTKREEL